MALRLPVNKLYQWKSRLHIIINDDDYWWNSNIASAKKGIFIPKHPKIIKSHLIDDIALTTNTQFQSIIQFIPLAGSITNIQSLAGALVGKVHGTIGKYLETEAWKSTDPLSTSFTIHLDTITDAKTDVFLPALALLSYTVPEEDGSGFLTTPGVNAVKVLEIIANENKEFAQDQLKQVIAGSRTISLLIGGWLYLSSAILIKAQPTFSKDVTESGFPLWCDINCEIKTIQTTTVDMLLGLFDDAQSSSIQSEFEEIGVEATNLGGGGGGFGRR